MIIRLVPYLNFNGNAEEAMYFYKSVFDIQKMELMRYKEMDEKLAEAPWGDKVLHGALTHDRFELFFSDMQESDSLLPTGKISLTLDFDSEEETRRIYDLLNEGGKVDMSLDYTFWDALFGSLTDRYGIHWDLNCQIPKA